MIRLLLGVRGHRSIHAKHTQQSDSTSQTSTQPLLRESPLQGSNANAESDVRDKPARAHFPASNVSETNDIAGARDVVSPTTLSQATWDGHASQ